MRAFVTVVLVLCLSTASSTWAQPPRAEVELRPTTPALRLREVRLAQNAERRREGLWLFTFGLVSLVGGGLVAAIRHEDEGFLAAGVTTASFGAIDAMLAIGLMDLSGARRRTILDDRSGVHVRFEDVREAELVAALRSGQGFAINAGLDVFYMAAGLLLFALGRARSDARGWEEGAGLAMVGQGAFLFAFDLAAWRHANARAEALRAVR
ncbi:MAG: hypothetical protein H6721_04695 [Sandaracinus sp.]|nr:hypothetical protein [Sandaracinus sp.]MCB9619255.1 hypothetical protein [Sandaracinus sp.]MCB9625128.1 hypothetical protein [Sandaracinus sp.]MCB9631425.1 hypothetical protein [Sandaracinus sp.]